MHESGIEDRLFKIACVTVALLPILSDVALFLQRLAIG